MDRLDYYRLVIRRIIEEYAGFKPAHGQIATETVFDREHNHYELLRVGWDGPRRVHGCVIHIDIRGGKVWVQHDGTDRPVATELLAAGIPHEDIVLGFHPPKARHYTDFAVG